MKRCKKCGEEKDLEEFPVDRRYLDGKSTRCDSCRRAYNAERMRRWRAANPERARAQSRKDLKRLLERNPNYFNEWYWKNVEKERERSRAVMRRLRRENPDWEREIKRRYRARNAEAVKAREREKTYARRAKQPHSPEMAALMAELVKEPCTYCGATEGITIDHIVPLSRGGKHEAENLAPACLPCNASKNNRLLSEWDGRLALAS